MSSNSESEHLGETPLPIRIRRLCQTLQTSCQKKSLASMVLQYGCFAADVRQVIWCFLYQRYRRFLANIAILLVFFRGCYAK